MFTSTLPIHRRALAWLAAILATASLAVVQVSAIAQSLPEYTQPELDQILAPIALYPDPLLSQIVMAATYPIEVVEAARWSRANPDLQGDAAVRAAESRDWDPSVTSLVAFPDVLARMDENLAWTRQLGDAFLTQEPQVMETIQRLRKQARAAGSLVTDSRIDVVDDGSTIAVQPADPRVIYVPYYDPRVAFGTWWWPAYPPVVWAPWPGYAVHYPQPRPGVAVGFFWGPAVRVSVGFFFGAIDWPRREVRVVTVNNYYYRPVIVRRDVRTQVTQINVAPGPWRHDPGHRRGVAYREPEVQRQVAPAALPRAEQQPSAAAPRRPETHTPTTRAAQGVQVDHGPPQVRRAELRQPENAASRTATSAAAPRTIAIAPPIVRDAPRRETKPEPSYPPSASPRPGAPAPTANAAPVVRDTRSGSASDAAGPQAGRIDTVAPISREHPRRDAESTRAQRDQVRPADSTFKQPRPPHKDESGQPDSGVPSAPH
jgi:Protein of unknown function (DUF3300)